MASEKPHKHMIEATYIVRFLLLQHDDAAKVKWHKPRLQPGLGSSGG